MRDLGLNCDRLCVEWVSAAEGARFVALIRRFTDRIRELGPLGSSENLEIEFLMMKLRAVRMALEGQRVRMVFARQAKYMKQGESYRELPPDHKLHAQLGKTLADETTSCEILLHLQDRPHDAGELAALLGLSADDVIERFKKLERKGLIGSDRLIGA